MKTLKICFNGLFLFSLFTFCFNAYAKQPKVSICHGGETYDLDLMDEADVDFVISVAKPAVKAHLKHGDCPGLFSIVDAGEECELQEDNVTVLCKPKVLCECIDDSLPE